MKTIKGKGYPYSENDQIGEGHGLSSFDKERGNIATSSKILEAKF